MHSSRFVLKGLIVPDNLCTPLALMVITDVEFSSASQIVPEMLGFDPIVLQRIDQLGGTSIPAADLQIAK